MTLLDYQLEDILGRLSDAVEQPEELAASDVKALLTEAAVTIKVLRHLLGIREDTELANATPAGRA